jgi:uncharacterized protein
LQLDRTNLADLARGCALLGAGGGGDPDLGQHMAELAVEQHGPVEVLALDALDDDALVLPCGLIGAPTVAIERIWSGDEGRTLVETAERVWRQQVAALMCYEIGGANGLLPVAWAARIGLPLVDADGMGRAFPEMQQQAMHLAGVSASPVILTDGRGSQVVIRAADNLGAERLARSGAATFGGVCAGALYGMTAAVARTSAVVGSISHALHLGRTLAEERLHRRLEVLTGELGAVVLIEGRLIDVERRTDAGFVRGSATIAGTGPDADRQLRIELQNEYLVAIEEGAVSACVPDIVAVLGAETGAPIVTERLRYGQRVVVVAFPGPELWRTPAGLEVVGPSAFGYELAYAPIARQESHAPA